MIRILSSDLLLLLDRLEREPDLVAVLSTAQLQLLAGMHVERLAAVDAAASAASAANSPLSKSPRTPSYDRMFLEDIQRAADAKLMEKNEIRKVYIV